MKKFTFGAFAVSIFACFGVFPGSAGAIACVSGTRQESGGNADIGAPTASQEPDIIESIQSLSADDVVGVVSRHGPKMLIAIIIFVTAWFVGGWVRRGSLRAMTKAKVEQTLARFISNMARWAVLILGIVSVLGYLGVETASFAAILAALGFAIGMALQGSLGNAAAGVMLLLFRPYKVGDLVKVADVTGVVDEIELFTTTLDTVDKRRIIVPNGEIFGSVIENLTHHGVRRADVDVGVCYGADIDATRAVLEQAAAHIASAQQSPGPTVYLVGLGSSSVDWQVRIWCEPRQYWNVKETATRAVKYALDEAGISIPFPQLDVHLGGAMA